MVEAFFYTVDNKSIVGLASMATLGFYMPKPKPCTYLGRVLLTRKDSQCKQFGFHTQTLRPVRSL